MLHHRFTPEISMALESIKRALGACGRWFMQENPVARWYRQPSAQEKRLAASGKWLANDAAKFGDCFEPLPEAHLAQLRAEALAQRSAANLIVRAAQTSTSRRT